MQVEISAMKAKISATEAKINATDNVAVSNKDSQILILDMQQLLALTNKVRVYVVLHILCLFSREFESMWFYIFCVCFLESSSLSGNKRHGGRGQRHKG